MVDECVIVNDRLYCWNEDHTKIVVSKNTIELVATGPTIPVEASIALAKVLVRNEVKHE